MGLPGQESLWALLRRPAASCKMTLEPQLEMGVINKKMSWARGATHRDTDGIKRQAALQQRMPTRPAPQPLPRHQSGVQEAQRPPHRSQHAGLHGHSAPSWALPALSAAFQHVPANPPAHPTYRPHCLQPAKYLTNVKEQNASSRKTPICFPLEPSVLFPGPTTVPSL